LARKKYRIAQHLNTLHGRTGEDVFPERYRIWEFPSAEQLAALREE
jgi:hypothetical protein